MKRFTTRLFLVALMTWLCLAMTLQSFAADSASNLADGTYTVEAELIGGSGRAHIESPMLITAADGVITATIIMSSPNYDYMIAGDVKYLPVNEAGANSTFEIPIAAIGDVQVTADTVAMGTPHEIEYTIAMDVSTLKEGTLAETAAEDVTEAAAESAAEAESEAAQTEAALVSDGSAPQREIEGLTYTGSMARKYAGCFAVDYFDGGYKLLSVYMDDTALLIVPEGGEIPAGLKEGLNETEDGKLAVIMQAPKNIYLVATSAMDYFAKLEALDTILLSGTKENDWDIEAAQNAMADGSIRYAGKYSAPDYEQIIAGGCGLAIESTMIYHTPEVKEKLESFGVPVVVEHSSYEKHPLGRAEWIRYYGAMLGLDERAEEIFAQMSEKLDAVISKDKTQLTVAVFSLPTDGSVTVRKSGDYMAAMIGLAGGEYVFKNLGDEDEANTSTVKMTMEDFYAGAMDADVLIYNATIGGNQESLAGLLEQNSVLAGFKAFKNGNVWCMNKNAFQHSTASADMIIQIRAILEETAGENTFEENVPESGNSDIYFYKLK